MTRTNAPSDRRRGPRADAHRRPGAVSVRATGGPAFEEALAELIAVPPGEFSRTRSALVSRLRKAGAGSAAARIQALKRPTIALWIVNRLAREERASVEELMTIAERMRVAQLGRRGREDLGQIAKRQRDTIGHLLERAKAMLREAGVGVSHQLLLRIETTLTAAASDPSSRPALRQGRLERELTARGFEVFGGAIPSRRANSRRSAATDSSARGRTPGAATTAKGAGPPSSAVRTAGAPASSAVTPGRPRPASVEQLRARLDEARAARARAAAEEAAQRERATAQRRLDELRRAVEQTTRAVDDARDEATRAAEALQSARKAKRAAERALATAERRPSKGAAPVHRFSAEVGS